MNDGAKRYWINNFMPKQPLEMAEQILSGINGQSKAEFIANAASANGLGLTAYDLANIPATRPQVDWVIAGGESGPGARPCDEAWLQRIALDCQRAGVPVFVKQMGSVWAKAHGSRSKGGDVIPDYLKIQEMP